MLNISSVGFVRYKTVKVATLYSIIQIGFSTHQVSPYNAHSRSQRLSICLTRWNHCILLITFTDNEEAQCVLWSYSPCGIVFFY